MEANDALNFLALRHAQLLEAVDENLSIAKCPEGRGDVTISESFDMG